MSSARSTRRSKPGHSRILRGGQKHTPQRRVIGRYVFVSKELVTVPDGLGGYQLAISPQPGRTAHLVFDPNQQQYGYVDGPTFAKIKKEAAEAS